MPFSNEETHPAGIANPTVVRTLAVLPAAGAWDAAPTEIQCSGAWWLRLYFSYDRAVTAVAGSVDWFYEVSPYYADAAATGEAWFHGTLYVPGQLTSCRVVRSMAQQEIINYCSETEDTETFIGPPVHLGGCIERFRVTCREHGDVNNPGTVEIIAVLYARG